MRATSMPGAGTRVLTHWLRWLCHNNYEVFVAAPAGGWLGERLSRLEGIKTLDAEFCIPQKRDFVKFSILVFRLCAFVIKNKIELIHCSSDVAYFTACLVAKVTQRPIVTHLHFHYPENFYSWLFGSWRKPDLVLLVSKSFLNEDLAKIHAVVPSTPVRVLHNCIEMSEYPEPDVEPQWESDYAFYPAAITGGKRQVELYRLDQILQQKGVNLRLVAAGQAKDEDYLRLCKEEEKVHPQNKVEFVGHVSDVASMYQRAFTSLTLSEYETFGYSVLESMASGVPVVGYRIGSVEEVLGENEYLVALGNVEALSDALITLQQDQNAWKAYSRRIRKRAENYFSTNYICPKLLELYEEVFENRLNH